MKNYIWLNIALVTSFALFICGCTGMGPNQHRRTTNLSAYLYPSQTGPVDTASTPVLSLPLHMGIAFVPADNSTNPYPNYVNGGINNTYQVDLPLSGGQKLDLMKQISGQFGQYPSLKSAELIPADYLVPRGGFENMDRIRALYGVDVMILLTYDQVQFTDEGVLTMSYWTVVGMYVVPAEKIETKTVLEAAVYDIASRKLLFRASGNGNVKGSSTPVNLSEQLRVDCKKSLEQAATNLVSSLNVQLAEFKKQIANSSGEYKIERKAGYTCGPFGETE